MFGKLTIELDKASLIATLALVAASFCCLIISNGLILFIRGYEKDKRARFKGFLMLMCGLTLFALNIAAIIKSEQIIKLLTKHIDTIATSKPAA